MEIYEFQGKEERTNDTDKGPVGTCRIKRRLHEDNPREPGRRVCKAEEIIEFKPRVPEELEDAINDLKKTRNKIDDVIQYNHEWKRDILEPE